MANKIPLMGFVFFVRSNMAKYLPYPVVATDLKVVNQHDIGEDRPFLGLALPGDADHEPAMLNLLDGYERVNSGVPIETVMREYAEA